MMKFKTSLALTVTFILANPALALAQTAAVQGTTKTATAPSLTAFPAKIDNSCRAGKALIFDQCSDQGEIYRAAFSKARDENKTLLVVYGAEWCIWTHVFDNYIKGVSGAFTHTYGYPSDEKLDTSTLYERGGPNAKLEAAKLARFVSDNFVVVYIENQYSKGGIGVLEESGADEYWAYSTPFVYTVKPSGKLGAVFDSDGVETRRDTDDWFRGYNRSILLKSLKAMKVSAQSDK